MAGCPIGLSVAHAEPAIRRSSLMGRTRWSGSVGDGWKLRAWCVPRRGVLVASMDEQRPHSEIIGEPCHPDERVDQQTAAEMGALRRTVDRESAQQDARHLSRNPALRQFSGELRLATRRRRV